MTIRIPVSHRQYALLDAEDAARVLPFRWYAMRQNGRWFAASTRRTGLRSDDRHLTLYLHRLILDASDGTLVVHVNGDTLDNQGQNLALVDRAQLAAMRRMNRHNTSGYRGVWQDMRTGRWRAGLTVGGRKISLGRYATTAEAARAWDAKAVEVYGSLAALNFPRQVGDGHGTSPR
jgi:hypothetical protein